MTFHNLKDIVMIYSSTPEGKPDYTWDKAKIVVWNPEEQREMSLVFTGSERPNDEHPGKINYNVTYKDRGEDVFDAFRNTLKVIYPNITDDLLKEYERTFIEQIIKTRQTK